MPLSSIQKTPNNTRWRVSLLVVIIITNSISTIALPSKADASIKDWEKGVSIYPEANNDFSTEPFQKSLANAAAIHANMATFIIPFYQTSIHTTDIQPGWNTPTDESLVNAITYAHSLKMQVTIKIHISPYYGDSWSAYINPGDREGWFAAYGKILLHYADLSQKNNVEQFCIGNELTSMSSPMAHKDNTAHWQFLIRQIRGRYNGTLTYNANWGETGFYNEAGSIGFWPELDAIGISAYFTLGEDRISSWDYWNKTNIKPLAEKYSKPVLFMEIGYRSIEKSRFYPWNFNLAGTVDLNEQKENYSALFTYWDNYNYMRGVNIWNWETNPNAGGLKNTDYTVQNKPAQNLVSSWFGKVK